MNSSQKVSRAPKSKLPTLVGVVVVTAVIGGGMTWAAHRHAAKDITSPHNAMPTTGGASVNDQKGEPQTKNTTEESGTDQPGDTKSETGSNTTNATLVQPSGDFVSNHHPNLGGKPAPNVLSSVCTTTPGANCVISFTKDGVTKSLPAQTTDRGGSAYWNNWSLQSIGLSVGSWKIQAIATLNGKTMSADDALTLEVAQ